MNKSIVAPLLLLAFLFSGCSAVSQPTAVPPTPTSSPALKIALVMKTLTNPFFIEMEKGARRAETEFGIQLIVRTAAQETSIEQQISIIDDLTQQKVDAIVIAPGDSKELIPVLKKAQDAGIVIINIDNRLDAAVGKTLGFAPVPFISVDNVQGAYLSARYLSNKVTTPTNVAIIEGIRTAQNAEDRRQGAVKAFKENGKITVVASETANWKIDEAHDVAKKIMTQYPDVKLIFAANDMMALGVIQYLTEAGLKDVMVAGFDDLKEARQAIQAGQMAVTIDQQAAQQGYLGVKYAVQSKKGEAVPPETFIDVLLIDNQVANQPATAESK
jgi:ribose transport system substrate-binding protein